MFEDLCLLAFGLHHNPEVYQLERLSVLEATAAGPFTKTKSFKDA